ncbi:predicted protein [Uncinocarpus reesii 1704]|uniref:TROVE domain-containing protein n=1 Tax=Uncinocarpus reesii (strain UAMH 1704) TaxID=336963 RepID=C4JWZ5_UNCRE|nr:uncharacterized protein UREG_06168 [Uncinocarpus reesii 1704]EEP81303.1 predicted protein [Uncinocarpus reesii 1704]
MEPTSPVQQVAKNGCTMASSFPAFLPEDPALRLGPEEFEQYICKLLPTPAGSNPELHDMESSTDEYSSETTGNALADALHKLATLNENPQYLPQLAAINRTITENGGFTFASTESALLDLFHSLDGEWAPEVLTKKLKAAWKENPLLCLKIIWNTRSIHLGKGSRNKFYIAMGWLKEHHPRTLLINLQWLFRPVIEKNAKPSQDKEIATVEKTGAALDDYEVIHGVSHGYWKDLLNLLALSANGKLNMTNPRKVLEKSCYTKLDQSEKKYGKLRRGEERRKRSSTKARSEQPARLAASRERRIKSSLERDQRESRDAKELRRIKEQKRHQKIIDRLSNDPFHRALHLTVARLFAERLQKDMRLATGTKQQQSQVSLCGKWAPSVRKFHDNHTRIATTIAEILFPKEQICQPNDTREMYLKMAREQYRFGATSKLRNVLQCVECDISANTFSNIKYNRVPSLAMDQYKDLFLKKDTERFEQYLVDVANGKTSISGAVLMPGQLISQIKKDGLKSATEIVINLQWNALLQRIKDCGSLSSSIAICDVSGSMTDSSSMKRCNLMDIAMGLSLIISDITQPPFGGKIITFSEFPVILNIGGPHDSRTLREKVVALESSSFSLNTDFLKVFRLILELAVSNKVKPEDMVKRLFVFSDMEFDQANEPSSGWDTHHQIITKEFAAAGYEVPEVIYWNLSNDASRHTPVTQDMPGTALVGGNNQAMLKTFLMTGSVSANGEEEADTDSQMDEDWSLVDEKEKKKAKITPFSIMIKTIGHEAYDMLTVVD